MRDQTDTPLPTLFCLPFAGGGASEYRLWPRMLDGVAEVRALQLPGRENLCTTPPLSSIDALMDILLPQVRACTGPFALFGHSLGALISYEIARRLQAAGDPAPKMLIASGRKAPSNRRHSALHKLSDADLKLKLLSFGGTPEKVMNHDGLMQMILPILRADLCVAETYAPPEMPALSCPILALAAQDDHLALPADLNGWANFTTGDFTLRSFPGKHFFLRTERQAVIAAITQTLSNDRVSAET